MSTLYAALAALLLIVPGASAKAASPDSIRLDLSSLIVEAQAENPSLRSARLGAEALATRPAQVSALPDPTVMLGYRPFAAAGLDALVPSQVTVEQAVPYPGKLTLQRRAADLNARAAANEADALALDLAYRIQDAYYELYRIQQQNAQITSFLDQLLRFEEAAATRYEVGEGPQQAILKAQLERHNLSRRSLELAAARRTQIERLARLTDRPGLASGGETVVLAHPESLASLDTTLSGALARRPEVDALRLRRDHADTEIALARRAYKPDFMLGIGIMDMMMMGQPVAPLDNLSSRLTIRGGVSIPLDRGARDARLEEARLERERFQARLDALETEIGTEINTLQARLEEDRAALALYESTLLPQAESTLESSLSAYTTGQIDFLDLLDAERTLFDLQMDYEETLARYLQTRALLGRTVGAIAVDLPIPNRTDR